MEFDLNKYLGKWFEIARIKNIFEPNMTNVTANYSIDENGNIKVINEGYIDKLPLQITGIVKKTNVSNVLQVSFFNNIFSDYKILFVDENYQYALVGGKMPNNLWVLSRTNHLNDDILNKLIDIAREKKYNVSKIIKTQK